MLDQLGIRRHLPGRRRAPSRATLTRILAARDGDALDAAIGAYLIAGFAVLLGHPSGLSFAAAGCLLAIVAAIVVSWVVLVEVLR